MQNSRWDGIQRPYEPSAVERLRPSVHIEYTLAKLGAERLWKLLKGDGFVPVFEAHHEIIGIANDSAAPSLLGSHFSFKP